MNTSTPNLLQVHSVRESDNHVALADTADAESIVLFVGHPHKEMLAENDQFRCVVTENVEDAKKVMYQLQHVFKRMPAVIIYRFEI